MDKSTFFKEHEAHLRGEGKIKAAVLGAAVGFGIDAVFASLYWMLGIGSLLVGLAVGALVGSGLGILSYLKRYRPNEKRVARRIDSHGLEERMITMVELRGDSSDIAELQREDAMRSLGKVPPETLGRRVSGACAVLALSLMLFCILVNTLGLMAMSGNILYGKELLLRGADGTYEISYVAGEGGYLRGEASQSVERGSSTEHVRAVASPGWIFVRWDDGSTYPERRETDVRENMVIKAVFRKIDGSDPDDEDSDAADDLPSGSVDSEGGGGSSDQTGGENVKDDGSGTGGGKWQDRNQFIDGATYYRDYLEFYYQYATGIFDADTEIPEEIIEFFEIYFSGI